MKFLGFFLLILGVFLQSCQQKHTIYIVRHAEKDSLPSGDVYLSQTGRNRANDLKRLLWHKHIAFIYSTRYNRTRETATPLGSEIGVPIKTYNNDALPALVRSFQKLTGNALVVGHSNTVITMLDSLHVANTIKFIPETDYDNIFLVTYKKNKLIKFRESTFGKPSQ